MTVALATTTRSPMPSQLPVRGRGRRLGGGAPTADKVAATNARVDIHVADESVATSGAPRLFSLHDMAKNVASDDSVPARRQANKSKKGADKEKRKRGTEPGQVNDIGSSVPTQERDVKPMRGRGVHHVVLIPPAAMRRREYTGNDVAHSARKLPSRGRARRGGGRSVAPALAPDGNDKDFDLTRLPSVEVLDPATRSWYTARVLFPGEKAYLVRILAEGGIYSEEEWVEAAFVRQVDDDAEQKRWETIHAQFGPSAADGDFVACPPWEGPAPSVGDTVELPRVASDGRPVWVEAQVQGIWQGRYVHIVPAGLPDVFSQIVTIDDIRPGRGHAPVQKLVYPNKSKAPSVPQSVAGDETSPPPSPPLDEMWDAFAEEEKLLLDRQAREESEARSKQATANQKISQPAVGSSVDFTVTKFDVPPGVETEDLEFVMNEMKKDEGLTSAAVICSTGENPHPLHVDVAGKPRSVEKGIAMLGMLVKHAQLSSLRSQQKEMKALTEREKAKYRLDIEFDPALIAATIGSGGCHVHKARSLPGVHAANVNDNRISIVAATQAEAEAALEELDIREETTPVAEDVLGVLFGKGGKNIRDIKEKSGVLRFTIKDGTAAAFGSVAANRRAFSIVRMIVKFEHDKRELASEMSALYGDMKAMGTEVDQDAVNDVDAAMREGNCFNCGKSGHKGRDCPEPRKPRTEGMECYNCGEVGHLSRDCEAPRNVRGTEGMECYNCGGVGHLSRDCEAPRKVRGTEGMECYNCGEVGHLSRDCEAPRKEGRASGSGGGGGGVQCYNCGESGHVSRDCSQPRKIKCYNCGKEGHTSRDCEMEPQEGATSNWEDSLRAAKQSRDRGGRRDRDDDTPGGTQRSDWAGGQRPAAQLPMMRARLEPVMFPALGTPDDDVHEDAHKDGVVYIGGRRAGGHAEEWERPARSAIVDADERSVQSIPRTFAEYLVAAAMEKEQGETGKLPTGPTRSVAQALAQAVVADQNSGDN